MRLMDKVFSQFQKPAGWLGTLTGMGMNMGHAKLWRWALTHIAIQPTATILDVGCGGGRTVHMLAQAAPGGKVHGVDHSSEMVKLAQRVNRALARSGRVEIRHSTISSLPFPTAAFDLVTAFESTLFWPALLDGLKEVKRVLKPGGTLLIANEAYKDERFEERNSKWVRLTGIRHLQTLEETREFLEKAGYSHIEVHTVPERNWVAAIGRKEEPTNLPIEEITNHA
jgi:ubiquinone/menaquinone biosynthesis C-methylase UbiE